jgi:hypothetical protein
MSEETRSASLGAAWGMVMSVVISVIFGFILLVAVTFVIPAKGPSDVPVHRPEHLDGLDGQQLGGVPHLHRRRRAVLLHDRVDDVRVEDDVRFSRDRAVPATNCGSACPSATAFPVYTVWAIVVLAFLTPLPAIWWGFVGYYAATAVAVIGLYIAFVIPIILRLRAGESFERTAWSLGKYYKIVDWIAIIWIFGICLVFMLPAYQGAFRSSRTSTGTSSTTRRSRSSRAFLLFGGWYVSARGSGSKARCGRARRGARSDRGRLRDAGEPRRPRPRARRSHSVERRAGFRPARRRPLASRACSG